jgi:hypothetical protein
MPTESNISWTAEPLRLAKVAPKYLWHRYHKLRPWGKAFIWCSVAFYVALSAFFIIVTPARIFQWLYDLAQRLSHLRLGWLALGGIVGSLQCGHFSAVFTYLICSPCLFPPFYWTYNGCDTMWICIRHERICGGGNRIFDWIHLRLLDFPVPLQ